MSSVLNREQILSSKLRTTEVEAFGGTILVSEMPAEVLNRWMEEDILDPETGEVLTDRISREELAVTIIVDEDGNRLLEPKDAKILAQKSAGDLMKCMNASLDITDFGGGENPTPGGQSESDSSSD